MNPTTSEPSAYGLWPLVVVNVLIFVGFAFTYTRPRSRRDWQSLGAFAAFVVALFTEMYGFPLTIYLVSGWLVARFPQINVFAHSSGHLWQALAGWNGDPHLSALHWLGDGLMVGGLILLGASWKKLFQARQQGNLATTGPYAHVRHPQYVAFVLIMIGFLLEWPTLPTLILFPLLTVRYVRVARQEEREAQVRFGMAYSNYAAHTPAFLPRVSTLLAPGSGPMPPPEHETQRS
ncbi:MAG TPA: isoprenylcysteine carboxylmethyltransferase family protein [Anaerolineales bacterium]|nr:isoprenylcysteine carboxylmethyltransferase family protein [Anaerolineales bacterium]